MKITVNTFGTRGDIQPYIALGQGLQQAGHSVRILSHQIFETFVRDHDLDFYPLMVDPRQVLVNQALAELGNNTLRINRWTEENFKPALPEIFTVTLDANRGADLIINSGLSFAGWHIAEKLKIPALATYLWPVTPSHLYPAASGKIPPKWMPFRAAVNYWSTKLSNQMFFYSLSAPVNQNRKELLDLPPMRFRDYWSLDTPDSSTPIIYGYSPVVLPKPSNWTDNQQISGYWFLDTSKEYQPNPDLLQFLKEGPPPIYIGMGSMVDHERDEFSRIIVQTLKETNQRGIISSGWSTLGAEDLPGSIFKVDEIPHDWLFPKMAAVIHHGGAGTTAAGLRAGVPSVIVPTYGDQFFWGWRVHELGAGPRPIPRKKLTVTNLTMAIRQAVHDEKIRHKSRQISEQIQAETGVKSAVRMIETYGKEGHL